MNMRMSVSVVAVVLAICCGAAAESDGSESWDALVHRLRPTAAGSAGDRAWDVRIAGSLPRGDGFQYGLGVDAGVDTWLNENWGYGVAGGLTVLLTGSQELVPGASAVETSLEGSAELLCAGASLLYRRPLGGQDWKIAVDAGLRYAFVSADVQIESSYVDHWGRQQRVVSPIDMGDRLLAVMGVSFGKPWAAYEHWSWSAGVGYCHDLSSQQATWLDRQIATDVSAFLVQGCLVREF
jgi:hypothetical protein